MSGVPIATISCMDPTTPIRLRTGRTVLVAALVLLATLLGGWRVVAMAQPRPDAGTFTVDVVSYRVARAEAVSGLSDQDLSGMAHGIQGLVSDDKAIIRVSLVLSTGSASGSYDPGALRLSSAGEPALIAPVGGSLPPGQLRANAQIEGAIAFEVPRNGGALSLVAPGQSRQIPLLTVDTAPAGAGQHPPDTSPSLAPDDEPTGPTQP